jgi:hypothetical protein
MKNFCILHLPEYKSRYPLMYTSKHRLMPVYIYMYYRYLESRKPSLSVNLDICNDQVCQMKHSIQEPDLVVSTSLLLYWWQRWDSNFVCFCSRLG